MLKGIDVLTFMYSVVKGSDV